MLADTAHPFGVLLRVAYEGTSFSGFVPQRNARTVGEALLGAVHTIDPRASSLRAVSRTDAGVHARGQVVSFDTHKNISSRGWVLALNQNLDRAVAVVGASRVPPGFDPRGHTTSKTYNYSILERPVADPLWRSRAWHVHYRLNHQDIASALRSIQGTHDFAAYRSSKDVRRDTVRTIFRAVMTSDGTEPGLVHIQVKGDRFLHRMVRIVVGTCVDIGRGRLSVDAFARAFSSKDRGDLGATAPAHGLYLTHIELDASGDDKWPNHASED